MPDDHTPNDAYHWSIQQVAALARKKERDETGCILVEGRHPIEEALRAGLKLQMAFVRPSIESSLPSIPFPIPPNEVDERTMARLADTKSPPPCLAVFSHPVAPRVEKLVNSKKSSLFVVLDGIQDPGNLGSLVRSAVAFGADAILMLDNTVDAYSPKVIRASAGLVFAIPMVALTRHQFTASFAAGNDESSASFRIYVTSSHNEHLPVQAGQSRPTVVAYKEADYTGRCIIILGNEGRGVDPGFLQSLGAVQGLTIPMDARVESLNVGTSGAIFLAEAAAQRVRKPLGKEPNFDSL